MHLAGALDRGVGIGVALTALDGSAQVRLRCRHVHRRGELHLGLRRRGGGRRYVDGRHLDRRRGVGGSVGVADAVGGFSLEDHPPCRVDRCRVRLPAGSHFVGHPGVRAEIEGVRGAHENQHTAACCRVPLVRIATWNVNSLNARLSRVERWLKTFEPDVLCLQETKLADDAFPAMTFQSLGYETLHHGEGRWNGVAILSKVGLEIRSPASATAANPTRMLASRGRPAVASGSRVLCAQWSVA